MDFLPMSSIYSLYSPHTLSPATIPHTRSLDDVSVTTFTSKRLHYVVQLTRRES